MPQMMPMNWIMMFMFLLSIMTIIMTITFSIINQSPKEKKMSFKMFHQWMW